MQFSSEKNGRLGVGVDTASLTLVAVEDVLVDHVALLAVDLGRVGSRQFVEDGFDGAVDVGPAALFFSPIEDQLGFVQGLQRLS